MVVRSLMIAGMLVGCSSSSDPVGADAGELTADAANMAVDATVDSGFGVIDGDCDVLDTELTSDASGFFRFSIAFDRAFAEDDASSLSEGARYILGQENAGGSSQLSEVFAYEVLERCEMAALIKTETEIEYDEEGKLTDFLSEIDAVKIGVSVTRAVAFPFDSAYSSEAAEGLLADKLADILVSSANVSDADRWEKQILAIFAYGPEHADALESAFAEVAPEVRADSLVYVIVTNGDDDFIYCNGPCE